jgi:hypothetical protein
LGRLRDDDEMMMMMMMMVIMMVGADDEDDPDRYDPHGHFHLRLAERGMRPS